MSATLEILHFVQNDNGMADMQQTGDHEGRPYRFQTTSRICHSEQSEESRAAMMQIR